MVAIFVHLFLLWLTLTLSSCKTTSSSQSLSENVSPAVTPPLASGVIDQLRWEVRFNLAECQHPGKAKSWCQAADRTRASKSSGVENRLLEWIQNPQVHTLKVSAMSFSNKALSQALCAASESRDVQIDVYININYLQEPSPDSSYGRLLSCAEENSKMTIHGRGKLGSGWLHHAKIFMAVEKQQSGRNIVHFTSSSANLSSSGTSLHYENWLLFSAPEEHRLAQLNLCYFEGLSAMPRLITKTVTVRDPSTGQETELEKEVEINDKGRHINTVYSCNQSIQDQSAASIDFYGVPAGNRLPKPLPTLLRLVDQTESTIRIAAHKITDSGSARFPLVSKLVERLQAGVKIQIVFDDDTILKAKQLPGSATLNVSDAELNGFRRLQEAGADIRFLDTNEKIFHLMHNKFMIFDDQIVFTGAGNFSQAALRGKNTEQFYVIRDTAITQAYKKGWQTLFDWSFDQDHFQ